MSELLSRLFQDHNTSSRSLHYRTNRFCNYIVLNLSIHCSYLNEIGIQIVDKTILLTINTEMSNKVLFETEWQKLLQYICFATEYSFLNSKGVTLQTDIFAKPFLESFIKKLSHYYFVPKRTKNKYIYKFCSYNENTISLLANNTLWFSDPSSFNDPFDCRYSIDADPLDREIAGFYYNKENVDRRALTFDMYAQDYQLPSKEKFLKDLEEHHFNNSFSKKQGICCFTEKYDNKLMWAHYAQNSTGLCLVFDTLKDVEDGYYEFSGSKVKYRNSLARKFYDGSAYFEVTDILYSKNKTWNYEREIREHITFEKGQINRAVPFDPQSLVGIIFGAKMNKKDKETIKNLTSPLNKYNIEYIDSFIDLQNNSIRLRENLLKLHLIR